MLVPKTARTAVRDARKQGGSMADTGKSNGHLGIHHPFGARHGTPVAGQRPPLAEQMYPKDWRAAPATLPVAADAPLEERLYPDSIHDVVARHSRGDHSDLRPYKAEPSAAVPYYRIGTRALDLNMGSLGQRIQKINVPTRDQDMEHMQFLGNDGKSNFGLMDDGFVRKDSSQLRNSYHVMEPKYNQELIDRARAELDAEWEKAHPGDPASRYHTRSNNCQDYIQHVLDRAKRHETPDNPLILP